MVANDVASLTEMTRRLLNAVRGYSVPAVGFVNEGQLFLEGAGPFVESYLTGDRSSRSSWSKAHSVREQLSCR
jgi:hypothetical protein